MITDDEVQKAYDLAPPELKAYIDSTELFEAFHEIRKAHNMHYDHAGDLALAIDAVVLGIRSFDTLHQLLRDAMPGVSEDVLIQVAGEVNEKIFKVFRDRTKKLAEEMRAPLPTPEPALERPSIRDVERKVLAAEAPLVAPVPEQTAPAVQNPSVIEQKLGPAPLSAPVTSPTPGTQPTPKYHGTDPYREMPE